MLLLIQVLQAVSDEAYQQALIPVIDLVDVAGCMGLVNRRIDQQHLVRHLCHFQLIGRVAVAIDQYALCSDSYSSSVSGVTCLAYVASITIVTENHNIPAVIRYPGRQKTNNLLLSSQEDRDLHQLPHPRLLGDSVA